MGDVVGHGIQAAATMGELRHALRAYAFEGHPPAEVVQRLDRLLAHEHQMATMIYAEFEIDTGRLAFVNAGHPAPLVVSATGVTTYLRGRPNSPLGTVLTTPYEEAVATLAAESTLILFTDGLVEGRAAPSQEGLDRLETVAAEAKTDPEALCDHLLHVMQPGELGHDDIALLALRVTPLLQDHFRLELLAELNVVAGLRSVLGAWLRQARATQDEAAEIVVACSEACMNVVEHAYALDPKVLEVEGTARDQDITIVVRDRGRWRPPRTWAPGYGRALMRTLTDELSTECTAHGTTVRMRRRGIVSRPNARLPDQIGRILHLPSADWRARHMPPSCSRISPQPLNDTLRAANLRVPGCAGGRSRVARFTGSPVTFSVHFTDQWRW